MMGNAPARRHAPRRRRNDNKTQLCQPTLPESSAVGVVGVRVFADVRPMQIRSSSRKQRSRSSLLCRTSFANLAGAEMGKRCAQVCSHLVLYAEMDVVCESSNLERSPSNT